MLARLVELGNADSPASVVGGDPTAEFTTAKDMTGGRVAPHGARYSVWQVELGLRFFSV